MIIIEGQGWWWRDVNNGMIKEHDWIGVGNSKAKRHRVMWFAWCWVG